MKKGNLIIIFFLIVMSSSAQWEPWSDPVNLTDTLSYNSNPVLFVGNNFSYMFYEKKLEENSPSMIYYRDIENMTEELPVFINSTFEFRNPKILVTAYPNYLNLLVYETNAGGNFDIWALKILADGSFGNSYQLTFSIEDENSTYSSISGINLCWAAENKIFVSDLSEENDSIFLEDIAVIDSGIVTNPICDYWFMAYCKIENDSSHIYYSVKNYNPVFWVDPIPLDTTGNNIKISFYNAMGYAPENIIFWEKNAAIYYYQNSEISKMNLPGFENTGVNEPSAVFYAIPVDYNPPGFVSFSSIEGDTREIFIYWMEEWAGSEVVNLSQNNLMNANPRLLYGWSENDPCYIFLLDIWETHYSQGVSLNMSKTSLYVCGGVGEQQDNQSLQIQIAPNPFNNHLKIDFYLPDNSPGVISIYALQGHVVDQIFIENPVYGWNTLEWVPGNQIHEGVYSLILEQGRKIRTIKAIYQ
jgi:hypothetical protein